MDRLLEYVVAPAITAVVTAVVTYAVAKFAERKR